MFPFSLVFKNSGDGRNLGPFVQECQVSLLVGKQTWQNGPASAPVAVGDVCPMDYYGNEATQMFRKTKKKKTTKTKQDANTEIIAIKTL